MTRFVTRFERPQVPVNAHGPGWFKVVAGLLRGMSAEPEERLDRTPMWTLDELCAFVRTTPATVHTWRKHGRAPKAYKIGRHLTGLSDHLQALGYTADQLIDAGVTTRTRNGRLIDRFRNRIIFPVRDHAGVIVGVTARISPAETDERAPKYLNTPETAAYRKSELLLGLDPAAIARLVAGARPVLVEGPTDHAALQLAAADLAERTGIEIVPVAACGTGITRQHL